MTVWANRSEFEAIFGDNWNVTIKDRSEEVDFILTPKGDLNLQIGSYEWRQITEAESTFGAEDSVLVVRENQVAIQITVDRDNLREDYDK